MLAAIAGTVLSVAAIDVSAHVVPAHLSGSSSRRAADDAMVGACGFIRTLLGCTY